MICDYCNKEIKIGSTYCKNKEGLPVCSKCFLELREMEENDPTK